MFNRTTVYILIAAFAAALGLWAASHFFEPDEREPELQVVRLFQPARALPAFELTRSDGSTLERGDLQGHWTLVFLGFTHCPDICPTTLAELSRAQKEWEAIPEASRPQVLFVSVDPERDTPELIGRYAHAFHKDTLAATGSLPALEAFASSLSMVFAKVPPPEGVPENQYSIDHSATIAVLNPQGHMAGLVRPPLEPAKIAADMAALSGAAIP
ncbi:SCO family protein [Marilutibacter alkalisoli]|uniref:SCO family protein n=1 Tax=Marilutibacter alkalisoli TaxID=2591633 RepID=A0A514BQY3_9GAMM|nr:SCO family protein [Lysobacter alkalisoli]QDH69804.1 SCO family protein [Lysobacter alkalisoli]